MKSLSVISQMKAVEQYFSMGFFYYYVLYKVVLSFELAGKI